MRIATRLTLLFVLLTVLVAVGIGWFAVAMSSRAQYATLDSAVNAVIDSGLRDPNTALSNALYVVQQNSYDLSLDVVFATGQVTQLNTATVPLLTSPTVADAKSSLARVTTVANLPGFDIRSEAAGGGAYLVVAASTASVAQRNEHLALLVAVAAAVIALLGFLLAREVMRRDLRSMERLIDYAGEVTHSDDVGPVPPSEGSRDIQDLRRALVVMVEALRERIAFETQTANAMQQFIDDASHELRTPLTVVKGYNDLLAGGPVSEELRARAVSRVGREVERMEELVRDLLLLAEIREVPQHPEQVVDLSEMLAARLSDFTLEHPERKVTSDVAQGVVIQGRAAFVDRLLNNALNNIQRHTTGNAPVRVTLAAADGLATLLIEDGGAGLPVYGMRPRRFHRFDESRSRETGGSGLGMSIMADVAESLGGSMTTERSDLGGLALRFALPLASLAT